MDPMESFEDAHMPKDKTDRTGGSCENLTVLDALAGLALEGLIGMSGEEFTAAYGELEIEGEGVFGTLAELSYRHAAAMLLARKKYL